MFQLLKLGELLKTFGEIEKSLGFRKVLMYTAYILAIIAIFNWKSIVSEVMDYMALVQMERHDKDIETRENISKDIHPYLIELRAKTGADRVMLYEFHNSKTNLIGIPFKYIGMTSHAEPYGVQVRVRAEDINAEIISPFIRELKVEMFKKVDNMEEFARYDSTVPEVLNNPEAIAACYQYMIVLGKPLGILVMEWHNPEDLPESDREWTIIRGMCSQATQDLNAIILKYKEEI